VTDTALPLNDIRVLEFSHAVMGPTCGLVLADLGAEVVKIEPSPNGDHTRNLKGFGTGYFTFFNRNKKSLAVNLKTPQGQEIIHKLLAKSDVLIENFAPGTMERLGLGAEMLSERYPRLVYCSLKGFLPGPYESRLALDEIVQMMSGLAYMTGPPGQPLRAGASIIDIMGGTYGALGVLVALLERNRTGCGQLVRNGLFETAAFIVGQHMAYSAISREPVPPMPARISAWAIYQSFETSDGKHVFIGITSDKHWQRFCDVFERPDLAEDKSLKTNNDRIAARKRLLPELERMFVQICLEDILELCEQAQIPFAPIARPEDLFIDPHLLQSDSLLMTLLPNGSLAPLPALPISLENHQLKMRSQVPAIGEHTREILTWLAYSDAYIESLIEAEIIAHS
jgi:crotonobetainyl-CoA:carnitine CoA-transferase CaiB-like acyl-CoA transferase